jgi:hypothetical protein
MSESTLGSYIGPIEIVAAYVGETQIEKIYQGSTLIEEFTPTPPTPTEKTVDVTDYQYTLSDDTVTLTKYIGASSSVIVPIPVEG